MLTFAKKPIFEEGSRALFEKATRERKLLDQQARALRIAFNRYVSGLRRDPRVADFLEANDLWGVDAVIVAHVAAFANVFAAVFTDAASAVVAHHAPRLVRKATPQVGVSFDPLDERAAALMRSNRLNAITNLGNQQRTIIRAALVRGLQQGLGPVAMARQFRNSIGLTDQGERALQTFERTLTAARTEALDLPIDERGPVLTPSEIEARVDTKRTQLLQARAEVISRTESLKIVGQAQEEALRQSLEQTGMSERLTGKEWQSTDDGRTRDSHAARNGARRRLNEDFAPGIGKPGDGGPGEAISCRCVLTFEFFDTEPELERWISGGS